jgi:hypothetical protein
MPAAGEPMARPRRRRRWLRRVVLIMAVVVGVAGVGGGGFGLFRELTRHATKTEVAAAVREEIASRWQRLPAGQIFPRSVAYTTAEGMDTAAHLVGIAPAASCAAALDKVAAQALSRHGCITALRATYLDASGTLVLTAGIVVLPGAAAAGQAAADLNSHPHAGVRAVAFPGTVAQSFRDSRREWFSVTVRGPYVFLSAVGYTTGVSGHGSGGNPALSDLGTGVANREMTLLTSARKPCQREDIRC